MIDLLDRDPLTLADMQAFHRWLDAEKCFDSDPYRNVAYFAGEMGEVVLALRGYLRAIDGAAGAGVDEARGQVGEELADCLAYVLKLANLTGIDLEAAYVAKMRRNAARTWHLAHSRSD